jgi:hypothetical protein
MLWVIASLLMVLWILGMGTGYIMGGAIHVLIVAAVALALYRLIHARRSRRPYEPRQWN